MVRVRTASLMLLLAFDTFAPAQADPLRIVRQVDFDEKADHGSYRSCSTRIEINFHDSACGHGTDSVTPERSSITLTITYTYLNSLKALTSVGGISFCETKPLPFKLAWWTIMSNDQAETSSFWFSDKSSPAVSDQKAEAILQSEETGIDLEAVREDDSRFNFHLTAEPKPIWDLALWQARRASHRNCISALRHS